MVTMLDCKKLQPRISEYIDGAMGDDEAWNIRLHIDSCGVCSTIANELRATASFLRDLPEMAPSANFEAMLASRLADQALRPKRPGLAALWNRFGEWWAVPRLTPAMATGAVALAALAPVAFFATQHSMNATTGTAATAKTAPAAQNTASTVGGDPALDEMWREHSSYSASEPLADPAGMLQARSTVAQASSSNSAGAMDISL